MAEVPVMRVAFVTAFPVDPRQPRGGVEAVSVHLVEALARVRGCDVQVVTIAPRAPEPATVAWNGATVHYLADPGGAMLVKSLTTAKRAVVRAIDALDADLVHAHDTFGIMAAGVRAPKVLTIHGFIYADTAVSGQRLAAVRSRFWKAVETRAWAAYPDIISISPYVRERLRGLTRGHVHDIENPIGTAFYGLRHAPDPATIFSAAVISRRKNPIALVDALSLLRRRGMAAKLRLAGGIKEPGYARALEARVRELGLEGDVTLLGTLSGDRIAQELERATVFALVSREENAPVGIQEAMAVGVPVVASNRCGMPYQVAHGITGFLVEPEDPDDIARRLADLLGDPERCARMAVAARDAARARFHPDAVAARTAEVYAHAVAATRMEPVV